MPIATCTITASLKNLLAVVPTGFTAKLVIRSSKPFFHGADLIPFVKQEATFDAVTGIATIVCIETETPAVKMEIYIVLDDGTRSRVVRFKPAIIPNSTTANLNAITEVDQYSTY